MYKDTGTLYRVFKDFHVWILPKDTIQTIKNRNEVIRNPIFDINIKKFVENAPKFKEGIEGVWKSDHYEIGLKKLANDDYVGFIIKADPKYWKQNEVKSACSKTEHMSITCKIIPFNADPTK